MNCTGSCIWLACSSSCLESSNSLSGLFLQAMAYKQSILKAVPPQHNFEPLMTCYLTDATTPANVVEAREAGVVAFKLYPAGATTNSDSGVTNLSALLGTLQAMAEVGLGA